MPLIVVFGECFVLLSSGYLYRHSFRHCRSKTFACVVVRRIKHAKNTDSNTFVSVHVQVRMPVPDFVGSFAWYQLYSVNLSQSRLDPGMKYRHLLCSLGV